MSVECSLAPSFASGSLDCCPFWGGGYVVVDLFYNVLPKVGFCVRLCLDLHYFVSFIVCNHFDEIERAGCAAFIFLRMSCYCKYSSVALPYGAVGWSSVCDFGISWSYPLTFWLCKSKSVVFWKQLMFPRYKRPKRPLAPCMVKGYSICAIHFVWSSLHNPWHIPSPAHHNTIARSGSVVECLTRDRRAAGSSLTGVTALWSLSKTHLS